EQFAVILNVAQGTSKAFEGIGNRVVSTAFCQWCRRRLWHNECYWQHEADPPHANAQKGEANRQTLINAQIVREEKDCCVRCKQNAATEISHRIRQTRRTIQIVRAGDMR